MREESRGGLIDTSSWFGHSPAHGGRQQPSGQGQLVVWSAEELCWDGTQREAAPHAPYRRDLEPPIALQVL